MGKVFYTFHLRKVEHGVPKVYGIANEYTLSFQCSDHSTVASEAVNILVLMRTCHWVDLIAGTLTIGCGFTLHRVPQG